MSSMPGPPPPPPMALPAGYESIAVGGYLPPPPVNFTPETRTFEMPKSAALPEEARARAAFVRYAEANCCYSKGPAQECKMNQITPHNAFHYKLESFCEARTTGWKFEPFVGQHIDGPEFGRAPGPWDIPAQYKKEHKEEDKNIEIPHTARVQDCHHCDARGDLTCNDCIGHGKSVCHSCSGSGRTSRIDEQGATQHISCPFCQGSGKIMCTRCVGTGRIRCPTCEGHRRLKAYLNLKIEWKNHDDNHYAEHSDMPDELIKKAEGDVVFEYGAVRVPPINFWFDQEINKGSHQLVDTHARKWPMERMICQRHNIRQVPVTEISYTYKEKNLRFWMYGKDERIHAPDYPGACGCTLL